MCVMIHFKGVSTEYPNIVYIIYLEETTVIEGMGALQLWNLPCRLQAVSCKIRQARGSILFWPARYPRQGYICPSKRWHHMCTVSWARNRLWHCMNQVWHSRIKISVHVASFYRPDENDKRTIDELEKSLEGVAMCGLGATLTYLAMNGLKIMWKKAAINQNWH